MADLVCSVYHDNFVNAVASINKNIPVFSRKSFMREFEKNIMYGFTFGLNFQFKIYEDSVEKADDDENGSPIIRFQENILANIRDLLQFKLKMRASDI